MQRLGARQTEAEELRAKIAGAVDDQRGQVLRVAAKLGTSRVDALRVRAAALRHERENLTEHMELLEEHLARCAAVSLYIITHVDSSHDVLI